MTVPDAAFLLAARTSLIRAAEAGGKAALAFYREGATTSARVSYKASNSPVTEADLAADAAISAILAAELPDVTIFSEEAAGGSERLTAALVAAVDPIDGTRSFIAGRTEWCVSIALIRDGQPVVGVIHAPARGETIAAARGQGATYNDGPLPRRTARDGALRISGPNRLVDTLAEHWPALEDGETLRALAYRLASVALGTHDIAVATPGAHDWDIAAAEVILAETGCSLISLTGRTPVYNAANPVHPALLAAEAETTVELIAPLLRAPA